MLVIPSIDVRGGRVVRLLRGDYAAETVFADDPVDVVRGFAAAGARRVHVVDLDAARGAPDPVSTAAVTAVVTELRGSMVEVEVGGGVRDRAAAQGWFERGASHVVVGSLAVRDPDAARAVAEEFPNRVLLGLDVRDGQARAQGWTEAGGDAAEHLALWASWPVAGVVHTAIERDGTMSGPAVEALAAVCSAFDGHVYASGGVTSVDDVAVCRDAGAAGVIVGRALHEGVFDLRAAISRFAGGAVA